jgi:hypothetical protein
MDWACNTYGRYEKRIKNYCRKTSREGDHLGDLDVDGRIILEWLLKKYGVSVWTGFIWPKKGSSGGLL